jgi:hypothetical protein
MKEIKRILLFSTLSILPLLGCKIKPGTYYAYTQGNYDEMNYLEIDSNKDFVFQLWQPMMNNNEPEIHSGEVHAEKGDFLLISEIYHPDTTFEYQYRLFDSTEIKFRGKKISFMFPSNGLKVIYKKK